jgi:hypothetical protein
MNTRCYRCGWSFSMSREALEEAAVSSAGQKAHVIHCPRCRQAISIPMDQIMRALPAGWTPATGTSPAAAEGADAAGVSAGKASAETADPAEAGAEAASEPADTGARPARRHRHSGKTNIGDSATVSAAKNSTHPN